VFGGVGQISYCGFTGAYVVGIYNGHAQLHMAIILKDQGQTAMAHPRSKQLR
jgi:hypothetical protein